MDASLLDSYRNALDIGQTVVLIGLSAVTWLRKPGTQAQEQVKQLHTLFTDQTTALTKTVTDQHHSLDKRMTVIEERVEHMPTREEVTQVKGAINVLDAKVTAVQTSSAIVQTGVQRIEKFLMDGALAQGGRQ